MQRMKLRDCGLGDDERLDSLNQRPRLKKRRKATEQSRATQRALADYVD
jgi:hypothetical protein